MSETNKWAKLVADWAFKNQLIEKAWFIGSHADPKKTPIENSDLDIAITLTEGHSYSDWFYESESWKLQLNEFIEPDVHLLRGGGSLPNEVVEAAIRDHGLLVFEREL